MNVDWIKCGGEQWCPLLDVNLNHSHFMNLGGVYIIWHAGQEPATVYVGQGDIAARLAEHQRDDAILKYSHLGLFVTWAEIDNHSRNGVERFLADRLNPKLGDRHPNEPPISVNLPW